MHSQNVISLPEISIHFVSHLPRYFCVTTVAISSIRIFLKAIDLLATQQQNHQLLCYCNHSETREHFQIWLGKSNDALRFLRDLYGCNKLTLLVIQLSLSFKYLVVSAPPSLLSSTSKRAALPNVLIFTLFLHLAKHK